ncbi:ABC transporter permease [Aquabacterium sp. CECT 9606]|uniref:ABC transporter permease n=1 Tax=Aquabacterium sp. CECT 9606 TaxID=2845822 RepID=UPI001E445035|nr:ABC transporter permease [Aquabacterium sp. CECT 9606]CAH0350936.1 Inner membrane transport permease YhhJ [Aquabacterium sp. CECT 9606]
MDDRTSPLRLWLRNAAVLTLKELRCVLRDRNMMVAIAIAFSVGVYLVATGVRADVANVSVGVIDSDHSGLSMRIREAIRMPHFHPPVEIDRAQADAAMDAGRFIFIVDIPPHFEADVHAMRAPAVQLMVDATAMTQSSLGTAYLNEIVLRETLAYLKVQGIEARLPTRSVTHIFFNPNGESVWFASVMQVINNVTVLAVVLVGAAVIREREHGTIEHLLVMPVRPSEIAAAKIMANGLVILAAVGLSVALVVRGVLAVPSVGSLPLFLLGTAFYLFSLTALGIMLATLASSMPQFALLSVPVFVIMYLLSGSTTPRESMPMLLQQVMLASPSTHYVKLAQAILYRGAGLSVVWPQFVAMTGIGAVFLAVAMARFRSMLAFQ